MHLNYYIDESGVEDWKREKYFTISSTVISTDDLSILEKEVSKFKLGYSKKLSTQIKYLHGNEITNGLNNGEGTYSGLKTDPELSKQFFTDLGQLLSSPLYQIVSATFDINYFTALFDGKLEAYYDKRGEEYSVSKIFNNSLYPICLLVFTEMIRKHLNTSPRSVSKVNFFIEEKDSDIDMIITRCRNRFSDVDIEIIHRIGKGEIGYSELLELADLSANAINGYYLSGKDRKDYLAIQENIVLQELIGEGNLSRYLRFDL